MRINMGCGLNKLDGYINIDKFATCKPDLVVDLEKFPWPFESDSISEVLFNHSLEHLGQSSDVFLEIMAELYRVCAPGARVFVNVPHPRHDHFLGDPTHVRQITPELFSLFSKKKCREWEQGGFSNSPLALYLNVDFDLQSVTKVLDPIYSELFSSGKINEYELNKCSRELNNVVQEFRMVLEVVK